MGEESESEKPKRKYFFSFSCGVEKRRESGEKICCFEASAISRIGTVAQSQRGRSIKNPLLATSISSHVNRFSFFFAVKVETSIRPNFFDINSPDHIQFASDF